MLDYIDIKKWIFSVFITEIPIFLPKTSAVISTISHAEVFPDVEAIHTGGKADDIDDRFGAFWTYTSLNDFSHIIPSGGDTNRGNDEASTSVVKNSEQT